MHATFGEIQNPDQEIGNSHTKMLNPQFLPSTQTGPSLTQTGLSWPYF